MRRFQRLGGQAYKDIYLNDISRHEIPAESRNRGVGSYKTHMLTEEKSARLFSLKKSKNYGKYA